MSSTERGSGSVGLCSCAPKCDRPAERLDSGKRGYVWCGPHSWSQDIPLRVAYAAPALLAALEAAVEEGNHGFGCAIAREYPEPNAECDCWQVQARAALAAARGTEADDEAEVRGDE